MQEIVKPELLHIQIYHLLKQKLMEGAYQPGERLVETQVAKDFGVSRGPVRESIRMLSQEGLIIQQGNTLHVFNPSLQDMIDIYQCRQGLESLAARLAADKIAPEASEELFRIIDETERAWSKKLINEVVQLNIKFHERIHVAAGNRELSALTSFIRDKVTYIRNCSFRNSESDDRFLVEHERIAIALQERDGEKAGSEMRKHIQHDLEKLIDLHNNTGS